MIDELIRRLAEQGGWGLAAGVALLAAYLMPLAIAAARGHRYTRMIGAINLVLGWTVIGWVAALFWAVNRDLREQPVVEAAAPSLRESRLREPPLSLEPVWNDPDATPLAQANTATRICPYCAEAIRAEAVVCRYCARDLAPAPEDTLPAAGLDERGMRELYDLLQEMERDAAQAIRDAKLGDVLHHSAQFGTDPVGAGEGRPEAIHAGESRYEAILTGESRYEAIKADRIWPDDISTGEIVRSREGGTTPSGKQTATRIKKAG